MRFRLYTIAVLVMAASLAIAASQAYATSIHVDATAPPGGDGLTWDTAYRYLQDALLLATANDEVCIAVGIYRTGDDEAGIDWPDPRGATFPLNPGVEIYGGYAGRGEPGNEDTRDINAYPTILSGDRQGDDADIADPADMLWHASRQDNSYHVITDMGSDSSTILDGLIISHGNASEPLYVINQSGAGIQNLQGGSPTIRNCTFRWNSAHGYSVGGAIANEDDCYPLVVNCLFEGELGRRRRRYRLLGADQQCPRRQLHLSSQRCGRRRRRSLPAQQSHADQTACSRAIAETRAAHSSPRTPTRR